MAFLDTFKGVMLDVFDVIFDDGFVVQPSMTDDGKGGYTVGAPTSTPCKAMVGDATEWMRREEGYNDKSVGLFVLQTPGVVLNSESEVQVGGNTYLVGSFKIDPVKVAWEILAEEKRG